MDPNLRRMAKENYKGTIFASWVFGIVLAVIAAGAAFLGMISVLLSIAAVFLIVYPIFFSFIVSHMVAKEKEPITFTNQFTRYLLYFRGGNSRSFRLITSLLFSLIVYFASAFTIGLITIIIFRIANPEMFNEIFTSLMDGIMEENMEVVDNILNQYQTYFVYYQLITYSPAMVFAITFFLYRTTINSIYIYSRRILRRFNPSLISLIHSQVFRNVGKKIRKDYLSLNWPFIPLFIVISIGIGVLTAFYIRLDTAFVTSLGIASGMLSLMFFFPFYFSNMEALFQKYELEYKKATIEVTDRLYASIRERIDLNEEEKKNLEDALNNLSGEENDEEEDNDEE